MRIEGLIVSGLLLLALVPSLIQGWRNVLVAAGCFLALVFVGFAWMLVHFSETFCGGARIRRIDDPRRVDGVHLGRLVCRPAHHRPCRKQARSTQRCSIPSCPHGHWSSACSAGLVWLHGTRRPTRIRHHGCLSVGVARPGREADASVRSWPIADIHGHACPVPNIRRAVPRRARRHPTYRGCRIRGKYLLRHRRPGQILGMAAHCGRDPAPVCRNMGCSALMSASGR